MPPSEPPVVPTVRVVHGPGSVPGGRAGIVVSDLDDAEAIVAGLTRLGVPAVVEQGRLYAHPTTADLAEDRVRAALGERVLAAAAAALDAWSAPPPDLWTPAGVLPTSSRVLVMGVLNVTPDSFSDGGRHLLAGSHPTAAVAAGEALLTEGADVIDVGGESTRPGAEPVALDEELARVVPVVRALASKGAVVSVDTSKAQVARRAVEAGAALVNDVSAGALDEELWPTVADLGVPYVLMHRQGTPRTMQRDPSYGDVTAEVHEALAGWLWGLAAAGVPPQRVVVDPGIGFGKALEHNLELLRRLRELTSLGRPVLVGASRKRFLGELTGVAEPSERLEASLAAATLAVVGGAAIVRVHDVRATIRAVSVARAVARSADRSAPWTASS